MLGILRSNVALTLLLIAVAGLFFTLAKQHTSISNWNRDPGTKSSFTQPGREWEFEFRRDQRNFGLTESQCNAAFPGLWKEIDRAVEHRRNLGRNISLDEVELGTKSSARALVRDNQLYIIDEHGATTNFRPRALATLNSINRAVTSYTEAILPDAEFPVTFEDEPVASDSNRTTWTYTRSAEQENLWLMPDFGFWGWPHKGTNSWSEHLWILDESEEVEFMDKIPKVVWRGSLGNAGGDIRRALVKAGEGHEWSDILPINWKNQTQAKERRISMEDHCDYMFTAQTEGNTYSGRFKLLLSCHSVPLAHKLKFIEHFHHLLVPSGSRQNYVQLRRDFSDLPKTMERLLSPSGLRDSRRIADNARRKFRERYLTPAAEACYWRALIRGWASVQGFEPQRWENLPEPGDTNDQNSRPELSTSSKRKRKPQYRKPRGVPFEAYSIMEQTGEWDFPAPIKHLCQECAPVSSDDGP